MKRRKFEFKIPNRFQIMSRTVRNRVLIKGERLEEFLSCFSANDHFLFENVLPANNLVLVGDSHVLNRKELWGCENDILYGFKIMATTHDSFTAYYTTLDHHSAK